MDTGLLIIRVVVGLTLAAHGVQKLFGWLDGPGIKSSAREFARLGYRPPMVFAVLAGLAAPYRMRPDRGSSPDVPE